MPARDGVNDLNTPYPVVDADPHFSRVMSYMRPSEYAMWAAGTAAFPAAIYGLGLRPTLKIATWLGFAGGFLLAYQTTSLRLWGWRENEREQARDKEELSQLAKEGKPLYGESDLPPYIQGVAHRNSLWSQLKFSVMPWFNFVHHPYHGTDQSKYKEES
ncbi:hypothetical protein JCM10296v2_004933 [Rhodotorula toruloides]